MRNASICDEHNDLETSERIKVIRNMQNGENYLKVSLKNQGCDTNDKQATDVSFQNNS